MYRERKIRSVVKAISWRFWATVSTMLLVFIFVGKMEVVLTIGVLEVIVKLIIYFFHERAWDTIHFGKQEIQPLVLWLTGLPRSGKTAIANKVAEELRKLKFKVDRLDGPTIRDIFPKTGFSRDERNMHIKRVGYLASRLENQGIFVVASFISPYGESREFARKLCKNFIEIYVSTPAGICEKRDDERLYERARKGEIKHFTGISDPYEKPKSPELEINTEHVSIEHAAEVITKYVKRRLGMRPRGLARSAKALGHYIKRGVRKIKKRAENN